MRRRRRIAKVFFCIEANFANMIPWLLVFGLRRWRRWRHSICEHNYLISKPNKMRIHFCEAKSKSQTCRSCNRSTKMVKLKQMRCHLLRFTCKVSNLTRFNTKSLLSCDILILHSVLHPPPPSPPLLSSMLWWLRCCLQSEEYFQLPKGHQRFERRFMNAPCEKKTIAIVLSS